MTYRPLGATGLSSHCVGFGGYRIYDGNAVHEQALRLYLDRGGNLIDTSANYGDGLSERLIGRVLPDVDRAGIVVVTKGGYIQGQNMTLAHEREFPETVRYANDLWHCIHPAFLETQIAQSRKRLRADPIDVYLLHNPEYYINYAAHQGPISEATLAEFYRRIEQAFRFLESQVAQGRIRFYGISSNNFGLHEKDRARVSVFRCLEIAEHLSSQHHFRVIQLPLNLYEAGGALFPTNQGRTVLRYAKEKGLAVLVNRPLNAFHENRLIRLADFDRPGQDAAGPDALDRVLAPLDDTERAFQTQFRSQLFGQDHEGVAAYLRHIARDLASPDHWNGILDQYVIPPLTSWIQSAEADLHSRPGWEPWKRQFIAAVNQSLEGVERFVSAAAQPMSDHVRRLLYRAGHPESGASLSRLAMAMLAQLDGVSCVLNGMRSPQYVDDAMGVPGMPAVPAFDILKRLDMLIHNSFPKC